MDHFSNLILDNLPWFWIAVTIICILIESCTMGLTTVWFACGAFIMVFLSFTHIAFKWQLLIFVTISCILLISTRPIALKKLYAKRTATNTDALIGKKVIILQPIEQFKKGTVKINGVEWSAKTADDTPLDAGKECTITAIEGATVIVKQN